MNSSALYPESQEIKPSLKQFVGWYNKTKLCFSTSRIYLDPIEISRGYDTFYINLQLCMEKPTDRAALHPYD